MIKEKEVSALYQKKKGRVGGSDPAEDLPVVGHILQGRFGECHDTVPEMRLQIRGITWRLDLQRKKYLPGIFKYDLLGMYGIIA